MKLLHQSGSPTPLSIRVNYKTKGEKKIEDLPSPTNFI